MHKNNCCILAGCMLEALDQRLDLGSVIVDFPSAIEIKNFVVVFVTTTASMFVPVMVRLEPFIEVSLATSTLRMVTLSPRCRRPRGLSDHLTVTAPNT